MTPRWGALRDPEAPIFHPQAHSQTGSSASTSPSSPVPPARQRSLGESLTTWCVPEASLGRMPARCVKADKARSPRPGQEVGDKKGVGNGEG